MYKSTAILTICMLSSSSAFGEVYNIVPIDLGDGYSIASGSTMTVVDGEVTDWSISVGGAYPYVFESPPSGGDLVLTDGLIVTEDEISANFLVDDLGAAFSYTYLGCGAEDYCRARLSWSRGFNPVTNEFAQTVRFSHVGVTQANGSNPDGPDPDDYVFNVSVRQPLPLGSTVIAVASEQVPEPTTGWLSMVGLVGLVDLARRRPQDNRA